MREPIIEECLKVSNFLLEMVEITNKIIKGLTEGPKTIAEFQTLVLLEQNKELNSYLTENFGVVKSE